MPPLLVRGPKREVEALRVTGVSPLTNLPLSMANHFLNIKKEYLLSTPANRESIFRSLEQLKNRQLISKQIQILIEEGEARQKMITRLKTLKTLLGEPGCADIVAGQILEDFS